ncbi:MAG: tol-pal system protein YbgF [Nitrospirota bacterium]|nr:tol-pal system protein YbgF [Nitrospirota bacterium]
MKLSVCSAVLVALMVTGCASTPKPSVEDELRNRMDTIEQNVANLKKTTDETIKRQTELSMIMLSLENKISDSFDKNDETMGRIDNLVERLEKISAATQASAPVASTAATPPPAAVKSKKERASSQEPAPAKRKALKTEAVSAEKLYQSAYESYEKGHIDEALDQFSDFAVKYPRSGLTDNAYYWIGEIYYVRKDFSRAILEFQRVVNEFPDENKAPDALYKIGLTYIELRNKDKAKQEFRKLVNNFPYSDKASLAQEQIAALEK